MRFLPSVLFGGFLFVLVCMGCSLPELPPRTTTTFESIGIAWSPFQGAPGKVCQVAYRPKGDSTWQESYPLWFDYRDWEYRGSLVQLEADTRYEIKLQLADESASTITEASTWSEDPPIGDTIFVSSQNRPLVIRRSGRPDGYLLYMPAPGDSAVIDVRGAYELCLKIKTNYIIVRGLTLRGATKHALRINLNHHIVVEGCDIADWGSKIKGPERIGNNFDSGIFSEGNEYLPSRIVIQDNRIHHPTYGASYGGQPGSPRRESVGPQAITLMNGGGNYVIRRNRIYSEPGRYFRDGMGEWRNHSFGGFPGQNSDIAGNYISHCWDDAIEAEGGNENVRIWGNYSTQVGRHLATANTNMGPLYAWRNVAAHTETRPGEFGGNWARLHAPKQLDPSESTPRGIIYLFHNTLLQPQQGRQKTGPGRAFDGNLVVSRNNLYQCWNDTSQRPAYTVLHPKSSLESDIWLKEGDSVAFAADHLPADSARQFPGVYWLAPGSPGYDQGVRLPGFNDQFVGKAPDVGAFENPHHP